MNGLAPHCGSRQLCVQSASRRTQGSLHWPVPYLNSYAAPIKVTALNVAPLMKGHLSAGSLRCRSSFSLRNSAICEPFPACSACSSNEQNQYRREVNPWPNLITAKKPGGKAEGFRIETRPLVSSILGVAAFKFLVYLAQPLGQFNAVAPAVLLELAHIH